MANERKEPEHESRMKTPYTQKRKIPTIAKYQREKQERQEIADQYQGSSNENRGEGHIVEDDISKPTQSAQQRWQKAAGQHSAEQDEYDQQAGAKASGEERDGGGMSDTSEVAGAAADNKQSKNQKKSGVEVVAERQVTDPVTHLPVTIYDLTQGALEEVPENTPPWGSESKTASGLRNKQKTQEQLDEEHESLQAGREADKNLFPPPEYGLIRRDIVKTIKYGMTLGLAGIFMIVSIFASIFRYLDISPGSRGFSGRDSLSVGYCGLLLALGGLLISALVLLVLGVRGWVAKRVDTIWEDEIWEAQKMARQRRSEKHETESVIWLNSLLSAVWPLINPDLFIALGDTLEDVMQASLPSMVRMVSVSDIGQGSENLRILGIRWLPTAAAARSVSKDGTLMNSEESKEEEQQRDGEDGKDETSGEGATQQIEADGLEAEEGDFINLEVSFAYRARSGRSSFRERSKDMHLQLAFYLPGNIKVPIWVDLRGVVGTMRVRMQLCPDPPFFSLCTMTFLGQPRVDISCTPLSRHALNIMDIPLISNFVQGSIDAAMAEYVAPKSLNLDLKDLVAGEDFKKDTFATGVLVVRISHGYDFKCGDSGIPLIKDGSADPYVSVGWAKFGKPVWSTRVLVSEMEPRWEETAYVLVTPSELDVGERLRVQLWDSDRMSADDDLGRIELDLKGIMRSKESNGRMCYRTDGFRALSGEDEMPGKLEWEVGYYPKAPIQQCQLQAQTYLDDVRSEEQLNKKVEQISNRKLRESSIKEGGGDIDQQELEQQRSQEKKQMEDAMMISTPPPDGLHSGIFSIQIHQITGLELETLSKKTADEYAEASDEEEEGDSLPSAYCTVVINHHKVFKTRTKPKNSKPFYNAGTEKFVADWRHTEVFVSVRDSRVKEEDPLLGIVHLPLGEIFKDRSQINAFYPLTGGVGYGRVRISLVWRSVTLQSPREALGWDIGTLEVQSKVSAQNVPEDLRKAKLRFHTDLTYNKMYARHRSEDDGQRYWHSRKDRSLRLGVKKRYASCLAVEFRYVTGIRDKTPAFAILWLKDIPDDEEKEVTIPVFKGDFDRARKSCLPEDQRGERVGEITLQLAFWGGLGSAHSKWVSKDINLRNVAETLQTARENLEREHNEHRAGIVDSDYSSSEDEDDYDDDSSEDDSESNRNWSKSEDNEESHGLGKITSTPSNLKEKAREKMDEQKRLHRHHRGLMQWRAPRTAKWAKNKIERSGTKIHDLFKHSDREPGIETET